MNTKDLVRVIREVVKREVNKQVKEQVTRILQEQRQMQRMQQPARQAMPTMQRPKPDFQVMLDEPIMSEATSPFASMMQNIEYDEFGGNMQFDTQNLNSIGGILGATAQQMQHEQVHGEGGPVDTSMFMKDYSKVLSKSFEKSNGGF